ncbi:Transmembrane protein 161A [Chionoecetes opilio]|uniref:Transmembrane protein 161A n=1 Tax=Chionoecetes opilio TaxID=41210 RepID=A0A8J4XMM1_CHIOP|nr:Transmembrane protein 161A [Chionoecetes opilio]
MPVSPQGRGRLGRRLRSGVLQEEGEGEWRAAATFAFPDSSPPKRSDKNDKIKSPNKRQLRRQTMMPRQQAAAAAPVPIAAFVSPPLSQRRSRRQSMMPLKLQGTTTMGPLKAGPPSPSRPPQAPPRPNASWASPTNKKRRLIPTFKSASQVKSAPSPTPSKKHKSLSALPIARSARKAAKTQRGDNKTPSASKLPAVIKESPVQGKKGSKKRALSPSQSKATSPARKKLSPEKKSSSVKTMASSSRSESHLVRGKSISRSQRKGAKVREKPLTPSPKKPLKTKTVTPKIKGCGCVDPSPATKKSVTPPKNKAITPTSKKTSSSTLKTPAKAKNTPKKKTSAVLLVSPATKKSVTPSKNKPTTPTSKKTSTTALKTPTKPKNTPKKKSTTSLKNTSPASKKTPKSDTKSKPTPYFETPSPKKVTKSPNHKKTPMKSPRVVIKKVKTPNSQKKKLTQIATPATPSPRRPRLTRSAAKSRIRSSKKVSLVVDGKSPPSSLASFRKTPSSKNTAVPALQDLGASPALPSARVQLERIRQVISSAKKTRSTPPRPPLHHSTATAHLDKVITKADIHASGNGKCGSEGVLANHCDPWLSSTPTARPALPLTPKSSRSSVSRISSRISSSMVETRHLQLPRTYVSAPALSSTPIKGSHALEVIGARQPLKDAGNLPEPLDEEEGVDGEMEDTSVEEVEDVDIGETSIDESVEEEEEEEEDEKVEGEGNSVLKRRDVREWRDRELPATTGSKDPTTPAVFGAQLVVTMVMASVLSRLTPHYSLGRWLLCGTGLVFYLHPTDEELRSVAGVPKEKGKKGKGANKGVGKGGTGGGGGGGEDDGSFTVPRNLELCLETSRLGPVEVLQLRFYSEYQWLLDFSLCAVLVYVITEVLMVVSPPKAEVNLSMLWCLLAIGFSLYPLVYG